VLGLVHFARAAGATHEREGYVVPLSVWAEQWPSLTALIEPLIDQHLRDAATVRRAGSLRASTDILIGQTGHIDTYIQRDVDEHARVALGKTGAVIIIGKPKSGKTRLAWQLLKEDGDSYVVLPHQDLPPSSFERAGLLGRSLYLFADDLSRTSLTSDLLSWQRQLAEATGQVCRIICTVRDGRDLNNVELQPKLARLIEMLGQSSLVYASKVNDKGADFPEDAGRRLAEAVGLTYGEFERRFDGTPGSLSLNLDQMTKRYERLRDESTGGVSMARLLDAAKLVDASGKPRLSLSLLRDVAERVRGDGSSISHEIWEKMLRRTKEEGLGQIDEHRDLRVYRSYLETCVAYQPSIHELEAMLPILEGREDGEGLYCLAKSLFMGPLRPGRWSAPTGSPLAEQAARAAAAHGYATDVLGWILSGQDKTSLEAERIIRSDIADGYTNQYINLGDFIASQTGREAEAEAAYRSAIQEGHYLAYLGLGNLLAKQTGREPEAEAAYRSVLKHGLLVAYVPLAQLVASQPERAAEAEEIYQDGITEIANTQYESLIGGDMRQALGLLLAKRGDTELAEASLRSAIAAGSTTAYAALGRILQAQPGKESEAEDMYRSAVRAGDQLANADLAELLAALEGRERDAEIAYHKAIDAGLTDAWNNLGVLLAGQSNREVEAENAFHRALEGGLADSISNLCILLAGQPGREVDAERACREAVTAGIVQRRTHLIEILMRAGRWGEVEAECRAAISEGNEELFYPLGLLLAGQDGQELAAEEALMQAIRLGDSRAHAELGALLESLPGREAEAEAAYRNAIRAGDHEANAPLVELLRRQGHRP